jgi:hypothetical protein
VRGGPTEESIGLLVIVILLAERSGRPSTRRHPYTYLTARMVPSSFLRSSNSSRKKRRRNAFIQLGLAAAGIFGLGTSLYSEFMLSGEVVESKSGLTSFILTRYSEE